MRVKKDIEKSKRENKKREPSYSDIILRYNDKVIAMQ